MSRIQWNLFCKIWIQNVEGINFKVISIAENSKKFPKIWFWKEKSIEDVVTIGPTTHATLVLYKPRITQMSLNGPIVVLCHSHVNHVYILTLLDIN
jgi:hypothetical protein